jgi:inosine/xanthosine triphosphatase
MTIAIGTTNPAKIEALKEVLQDFHFLKEKIIVPRAVSSEVREQPLSLEEMIRGAKARAKNSYSDEIFLSFGLESGLFKAIGTESGYLESCICAIYDGTRYAIGISCGFELPKEILKLILEENLSLNEACLKAKMTDNPKLGASEGFIGVLTKGRIDRKKYTKQCILTALLQIENSSLYQGGPIDL